jgi:hypothetical protein
MFIGLAQHVSSEIQRIRCARLGWYNSLIVRMQQILVITNRNFAEETCLMWHMGVVKWWGYALTLLQGSILHPREYMPIMLYLPN